MKDLPRGAGCLTERNVFDNGGVLGGGDAKYSFASPRGAEAETTSFKFASATLVWSFLGPRVFFFSVSQSESVFVSMGKIRKRGLTLRCVDGGLALRSRGTRLHCGGRVAALYVVTCCAGRVRRDSRHGRSRVQRVGHVWRVRRRGQCRFRRVVIVADDARVLRVRFRHAATVGDLFMIRRKRVTCLMRFLLTEGVAVVATTARGAVLVMFLPNERERGSAGVAGEAPGL